MQVMAHWTPARPDWRWRIVNYAGELVEESHGTFPTIATAIAAASPAIATNLPGFFTSASRRKKSEVLDPRLVRRALVARERARGVIEHGQQRH